MRNGMNGTRAGIIGLIEKARADLDRIDDKDKDLQRILEETERELEDLKPRNPRLFDGRFASSPRGRKPRISAFLYVTSKDNLVLDWRAVCDETTGLPDIATPFDQWYCGVRPQNRIFMIRNFGLLERQMVHDRRLQPNFHSTLRRENNRSAYISIALALRGFVDYVFGELKDAFDVSGEGSLYVGILQVPGLPAEVFDIAVVDAKHLPTIRKNRRIDRWCWDMFESSENFFGYNDMDMELFLNICRRCHFEHSSIAKDISKRSKNKKRISRDGIAEVIGDMAKYLPFVLNLYLQPDKSVPVTEEAMDVEYFMDRHRSYEKFTKLLDAGKETMAETELINQGG